MLFAPGLFSMMIACPSFSSSPFATRRVTESVIPPGVYGTIHLLGLFGYAGWPHAEPASASDAAAAPMICRIDMVSSLLRPVRLHCSGHGPRLLPGRARLPRRGARLARREPPGRPSPQSGDARGNDARGPAALAPDPRRQGLDRALVAEGMGRHRLVGGAALH